MGSASVVVDGPLLDNRLQVALAEWDQEIEALATEAAAEPLTYRVGPGRPHRRSVRIPGDADQRSELMSITVPE